MRAARFHAQEDVRIEEVDEPSPGAGQVKLRNGYAGICGSDLHVFYSPENSGLDFSTPHPLTGSMPPQVLGHEFSGTVVELGEGVDGVAVGDRVAVWPVYHCGTCAACSKGMVNACRSNICVDEQDRSFAMPRVSICPAWCTCAWPLSSLRSPPPTRTRSPTARSRSRTTGASSRRSGSTR